MNQDAFWGITLSVIVLRWWWKNRPLKPTKKQVELLAPNLPDAQVTQAALQAKELARKQRERDIAQLKKQGYDDELIATIIPVIKDDE